MHIHHKPRVRHREYAAVWTSPQSAPTTKSALNAKMAANAQTVGVQALHNARVHGARYLDWGDLIRDH